jgi:predicted ATPase
MKYRESQLDKQLRKKFEGDYAHSALRKIVLKEGALRGLTSLDISFCYPITAIAGKNGAGKSTILALACCAFHNAKTGYRSPKRKNTYYTFSDFFIQHAEEVPPEGVEIHYHIAHNRWKKTEQFPGGIGVGRQLRQKKKGGKWNDYDERVNRNVVFLGIDRIVPHIERSQSRSYSRVFSETPPKGWEGRVSDAVGYVLNRKYDSFRRFDYSKYSLPVVKVGKATYSGFNMGAGENALFEIFSTIYSCGNGALLVMDEIELGLHAEAQRRFIEKLKQVCFETNTQVICTTHSKEIFDALPYDARYFIENVAGKTRLTPAISSDFAFSKLSAKPGIELDIFVEDDVAEAILQAALPAPIRSRSTMHVIGSASALSRQLAAIRVRGEQKAIVAIFDGDQSAHEKANLDHAKKMCEKVPEGFDSWFSERVAYIPGESWPEAWLLQKALECLAPLAEFLSVDKSDLAEIIEYGQQAGKHDEFFEISKHLGMAREMCLQVFAMLVCNQYPEEFAALTKKVSDLLADAG